MGKVFLFTAVFSFSLFSLAISQPAAGSKKAPEPRFLGLGLLGASFAEVTVSGTWSSSGGHKPGKPGKKGHGHKGGSKGGHRDDNVDYTDYYDGGGALEELVGSWIG